MDKGHFLRRLHSPPLHSSPREQMSGRGNTTGTERWRIWRLTPVGVVRYHFLMNLLTSPVQLHLLIIPPPPHKELTNTDAKQGQMSLRWQVGSMGAWGGEMVRAEMESHNSNKLLGLLKNTEGLGEWMREEERMRNMWYFNKRYQGRSWWFRDSCLLKSETFLIVFHSQLFRLFFLVFLRLFSVFLLLALFLTY